MAATLRLAIGAASLLALGSAGAQAAPDDPTRPPAHLLARPAAPSAPGTPQAPARPALELQAIVRSTDGSASATINGWVLRPGDTISGARLLEIGAHHAVLEHGTERTRLSLTPGIRRTTHDETSQAPASLRPAITRKQDSGEKR
ncbi:MAG: hypothetical protein KJZ83_11900 [Burkholderiaceae bacterium]|nr:hypothetical protein [Burkholderiaceae bacterium]